MPGAEKYLGEVKISDKINCPPKVKSAAGSEKRPPEGSERLLRA